MDIAQELKKSSLREVIAKINTSSDEQAEMLFKRDTRSNLLKIFVFMKLEFFRNLLGNGTVVALLYSFNAFLVWGKLWLLQKQEQKNKKT